MPEIKMPLRSFRNEISSIFGNMILEMMSSLKSSKLRMIKPNWITMRTFKKILGENISHKATFIITIVSISLLSFLPTPIRVYADDSFPALKSPWETGQVKSWTTGLHGPPGLTYCSETTYNNTYGLDFGGGVNGFEVLASTGGVVVASEFKPTGGYGNYIRIRHNNAWETEYVHLASRLVSVNDQIIQGQVIGMSGNTGCGDCGNHLHFALRKWKFMNNIWDWYYETWNDQTLDGWRIHEIRARGGSAPLYAEATATQ